MYSPLLLDHFQNPHNAGEVADPDASVQIENPACGDILKLAHAWLMDGLRKFAFAPKDACQPSLAAHC